MTLHDEEQRLHVLQGLMNEFRLHIGPVGQKAIPSQRIARELEQWMGTVSLVKQNLGEMATGERAPFPAAEVPEPPPKGQDKKGTPEEATAGSDSVKW